MCIRDRPIGDDVPYGTGFAVMQAMEDIDDSSTVVILYGDTPLITESTIDELINYHSKNQFKATVLTAILDDPTGYGRIIREDTGDILKIVEQKDASEEEKKIKMCIRDRDRVLFDQFCGSGTIPIEAAMIGRNMAPGLDRNFAAEKWPRVKKEYWQEAKKEAFKAIDNETKLHILGCDIDRKAILRARDNAANFGLEDDIAFFIKDFRDAELKNEYGVVITNPPYGERISERREVERLHKDLGLKFKELDTWSVYVITSNENFEKDYGKMCIRDSYKTNK